MMIMWPQIRPRSENLRWSEVVHPGQDCGTSLTRYDSMVNTAMAIEREIDDAQSILDTGVSEKRKED